jgi:ketosteroid isomerase-like protein
MNAHEQLIRDFYAAFAAHDATGMARCYHPDIFFSDTVFPSLHGQEATAMWAMLCARGKDLEIILSDVQADEEGGTAQWDAKYTFSQTGRFVHNKIDARFAFRDGKIVRHLDRFSFWAWARQALGPVGLFLGWFGPIKSAVRKKADRGLRDFMSKHEGNYPVPPL